MRPWAKRTGLLLKGGRGLRDGGEFYRAMLNVLLADVRSILQRDEKKRFAGYLARREALRRSRPEPWEPMYRSWMD